MKKNNTFSILFFLLIVTSIAQMFPLFLKNKSDMEGFLAPGTHEGGAQWNGKVWNFISRNHSVIPPIDLNTEGAILGEMNNLQLLPFIINDNLKGDSFKRGLLQVQRVTTPPVRKQAQPNPFVYPKNPFQLNPNPNANANIFQNTGNAIRNIFQPPNPFQQQQKTWNSIFHF